MTHKARAFSLRGMGRIVFLLLVVLLAAAPAWGRSIRVTRWDTTAHVDSDGSARITEQITYLFTGAYHGVYRDIPIEYPGPRGSNYSLFLKIEKVTDAVGSPLKYEKSTKDGFLKLKVTVPGAVDASKMVIFEYSVANAVKFFDDHEEFYWNVTGNDSPLPIEHASAIVYLPENTSGSLQAQAFVGTYGSTERGRVSVEGPVASAETTAPLPMHGGLTIDVYIPKDLLKEPSGFTKIGWFLRSNPIVTLPLWAFAVMFPLWWFKGRDPDPGMSVAPMYEPPEKMGPAEVGTLIDDSVEPRDITSVMVDLAVRGYIKIVETQHKGLLFTTKDYDLQLLKDRNDWSGLTDYERAMLDRIFYAGNTTRVSDLRNRFYTAIPLIKEEVMGALKAKGMYTLDPDSSKAYLGLGAVLVLAPYALAQWFKIADFLNSMGPTIVCVVIAVAVIVIFGRQLSATSMKGARTRVQILGFQDFMNRVDADRLKRMPPDTFEKFLPYAMALGVEHHWAKAFEGIVQNPPNWYQGDWTTFNTFYFVNSLGAMSQTTAAAFVAAPRASSSSSGFSGGGFSSGGFSGGGFGGGGTGGW
jgi:uncharacterized membrane protein